MTKTETIKIMAVLRAAYPQYYAKQSDEDLQGIVNLWAEMFDDEPYEVVAMATKALIKTRTSTFPPTIGEINERIQQIVQPEQDTAMEAWGAVIKAIRNGNYGYREEFEKLPPLAQKIVGSPNQLREWALMDSETINSVVASNFRQSYNAKAKNEREYIALPKTVKAYMKTLTDKLTLKQIEG